MASSHSFTLSGCVCRSFSRGAWFAFGVCLALRLLYLAAFGDRLTAFGYEHGFGTQALALLQGRGLMVVDDHTLEVDALGAKRLPFLLQPGEYPPLRDTSQGYYHAIDMPGYPWLLATFWFWMKEPTFWPVKAAQAVASALLIFPLWDIARRLFGGRAALIAAWFWAFWLPSAYLAQMASKEGCEAVFVILCAWFALRYLQEDGFMNLAGSALAMVCGAYLRTNLLVLAGAIGVVGAICFSRRRAFIYLAVVLMSLAICLLPWVMRNKRWVDPQVGLKEGFYWGIIGGMALEDPDIARNLSALEGRRVLPDGAPNKLLREPPEVPAMTKRLLKERTGWYVSSVLRRTIQALFVKLDWGYEILPPQAMSVATFRSKTGKGTWAYLGHHPFAALFKGFARCSEVWVGVMSLAAFWLLRDRWRQVLWLAGCYWVFVAVYAPIHLEFRYIAPHTWALAILAAAGVAALWSAYLIRPPLDKSNTQIESNGLDAHK